MKRNGFFRRWRATNHSAPSSAASQSPRTDHGVAPRPTTERLPPLREDSPDSGRPGDALRRLTFDSSTSAADKAFLASRALTKRWSGADDEEEEDSKQNQIRASESPFFKTWIDQQQHFQSIGGSIREKSIGGSIREKSIGGSIREKSLPETVSQDAMSAASTEKSLSKIGRSFIATILIGICLTGILWSEIICNLALDFSILPGSSPSFKDLPNRPLRDRYFKALVHDDSTGRFGLNFEKGIIDAASLLRVNVSIQRSPDLLQTAQNIDEASCSLFDGLIITLTESQALNQVLERVKDRTPIITTGALESSLDDHEIGHLGEQEVEVGDLAARRMKEAGMKTSVCLSRADNIASVHRCRGFKKAFGAQTYELNLNTMLQSELKSKLIPTILDDDEIDGLFVADPRSFSLVHQILKSLNRLCLNKKATSKRRCIYFGTYGMDLKILQAIQRSEIQFTVDPQEYLHGYLALTWTMLVSYGFPLPVGVRNPTFQLSRILDSSEQAKAAIAGHRGSFSSLRFQFFLYGEVTADYLRNLKQGLRNAARDLNVHVELHRCMNVAESNECAVGTNKTVGISAHDFNGFAFSASDPIDSHILTHFKAISSSGRGYVTFGEYQSFYEDSMTSFHVGHHQMQTPNNNKSTVEEGLEPALQGYLSVLFLVINSRTGEIPRGFLNTRSQSPNESDSAVF